MNNTTKFVALRSTVFLFLLCISAILSFFFLDKQILNWTTHLNKKFVEFFTICSYIISPQFILTIWIGLFLVIRFMPTKHALTPLCFEIVSIQCLSFAIMRLSKVLIGRARPDIFLAKGIYGFYGFHLDHYYHSFPSGHAMAICTLATSLSFLYPHYRLRLYTAAIALSFIRVFIAQHYVSDILGTCAIAIVTTTTVHVFFKNLIDV